MTIAERREREKERRKTAILDAAEQLFFARGYEEVSMNDIAAEVELNKATLYLYFKNKEALFLAVVLRGLAHLNRMYRACIETEGSGIARVGLMGDAYHQFYREHPEYIRMIRYYGSERFKGKETPETTAIWEASNEGRHLIYTAVQQGIEDGTIRNDLDPLEITLYLMITFMNILSPGEKWTALLDAHAISNETFASDYLRFLRPALARESRDKQDQSAP